MTYPCISLLFHLNKGRTILWTIHSVSFVLKHFWRTDGIDIKQLCSLQLGECKKVGFGEDSLLQSHIWQEVHNRRQRMNWLQATGYLHPACCERGAWELTAWWYTGRSTRRWGASRVDLVWADCRRWQQLSCCPADEECNGAAQWGHGAVQQQNFDKHKPVAYWQHHYFSCLNIQPVTNTL